MTLLTMLVFLSTNYYKINTLLSHIIAKIKGFSAIFNLFKIVTKNTAMFQLFSNIVKNMEHNVFSSEHHLKIAELRIRKHRIVKNIALLRKVNIAHP